MDNPSTRRSHFQDNGLASTVDVASRPTYYSAFQRRGSLRTLSFPSSVSSPRFFDEPLPRQPHFLESCFLCRKPIGGNKDIYMYRGDTPFCSEECRQEQIEIDEAKEKEKKWNRSSSLKSSLRKNQKKTSSTSPNKAQGYPFRTGTVAAA